MNLIYTVILAGGLGQRLDSDTPKQFLKLGDQSIITRTIEIFNSIPEIDVVIPVLPELYINRLDSEIDRSIYKKVLRAVSGGKTRQESSYNAVTSMDFNDDDILLFHDAARPFIRPEIIIRVINETAEFGAAGTYIPTIDTITEIESGFVKAIPQRKYLFHTQTPQGFLYKIIRDSHDRAISERIFNATDDVTLVVNAGYRVKMVEGDHYNFKITDVDDFKYAEYLINNKIL